MRFLIIFILTLFFLGCKPSEVPARFEKDLDSISAKWVPDKREGISNFSLIKSSNGKLVFKGETDIPELKSELTAYLNKSGLEYIDSLMVLPDISEVEKPWGLVSVSVCNIKWKPSFASELVSQAIMGTPVKILKKRGSWLLLQTPDHYIGWTDDSGIRELSGKELDTWKQTERVIYLNKSGDILSETAGESVVSDIVSGAILVKSGEAGDYYTISLPDGRIGRVLKKDVADFSKWCAEITPEADKLILFAKSLNGYPYQWGGTSTKGVDCSGFTRTVYFTGGLILARDASLQFLHGIPVGFSAPYDSLKPGDLLFFGHLNPEGVKRITHVGMYIGGTEVIHSSGMVRISSLDSTRINYSPYLKETLLGARRVIGADHGRGIDPVSLNDWYNFRK